MLPAIFTRGKKTGPGRPRMTPAISAGDAQLPSCSQNTHAIEIDRNHVVNPIISIIPNRRINWYKLV